MLPVEAGRLEEAFAVEERADADFDPVEMLHQDEAQVGGIGHRQPSREHRPDVLAIVALADIIVAATNGRAR